MASVNNAPPPRNRLPIAPQPQPVPPIVPMEENAHAGVIIGVVVFVVVIIIIILLILLIMALIRYRKANLNVNGVENSPINPTQTELSPISDNYIRREQPVQAGRDIPSTPLASHDSDYDYPKQSCSPVFNASDDLNRRPNFDNSGNSADFCNYDTLPADKKPVPYYPQNSSKPVLEQKSSHYDYISSKPRKVEPVYDHPPASPRPVQKYPKTDYHSSNFDAQVEDNAHHEHEPIYANYGEGNHLEISNEVIADSPTTTKLSKRFPIASLKGRFSSSRKKNKSTIAKHTESFEEPIYANEPCHEE